MNYQSIKFTVTLSMAMISQNYGSDKFNGIYKRAKWIDPLVPGIWLPAPLLHYPNYMTTPVSS